MFGAFEKVDEEMVKTWEEEKTLGKRAGYVY